MLDARDPAKVRDGAPHHGVGARQRRARWQLGDSDEIPLVLSRDEAGGCPPELHAGQRQQHTVRHEDERRHAYQRAHRAAVMARDPIERDVEPAEELRDDAPDARSRFVAAAP